jgi:hypothetical protein
MTDDHLDAMETAYGDSFGVRDLIAEVRRLRVTLSAALEGQERLRKLMTYEQLGQLGPLCEQDGVLEELRAAKAELVDGLRPFAKATEAGCLADKHGGSFIGEALDHIGEDELLAALAVFRKHGGAL